MSAKSVIFNLIANDKVTEGVKKAGKSLDELNTKVNRQLGAASKKAALAGGAAAGGAFVAGLTGMIELDNARGKLEAQLGLTKDQSKRIGDVAGKLFAGAYGESMDEVNAAVASVVQNMDGMRTASSRSLQDTTAKAMTLATVMDEDVGAVTRSVSQMLRTGMAKNAQEAFDILTRGAQTGANKAQDLLDTFNEYGTQFRKLGLNGTTAMGLIQQGLQGGARDADLAADALKEFSIRAIDGSKNTVAGFQALGLNADKMAAQIAKGGPSASKALNLVLDRLRAVKDPIDRSTAATGLFGTQWEDMGSALLKMDPSKATAALGAVKGATDKASNAMGNTAQARFTAFTRTLKQDVAGAIGNTVGWMSRHTTAAKVLAGVAGTLVAAWAAYNVVAGVMAARTALMTEGTVANTIVTKIAAGASKAWAAGQWLLNAAMSANPISLIIIAIVALVAAVVIAYKRSETFRAVVQAVWSGIKTAIAAAWNFIRPVLSAVGHIVGTVLRIAFTVLKNVVKATWIGIQIAIKIAWALIRPVFTTIRLAINVLGAVFRWLWHNAVAPAFAGLKLVISAGWTFIRPIFNTLKSAVGKVGDAFKTAVAAIRTHWDKIKNIAKAPVNFVIGIYNRGIVDLVNKVASFAGIKTRLGHIATLASGGTLANPAKARPMMTKGPMAIVGEGRKQYPEFVIPTDPKYRGRAQALWASAGNALAGGRWMRGQGRLGGEGIALAGGGIIGGFLDKLKGFSFLNPLKAFKGALGRLVGTVPGSGVFRDAVAAVPGKAIGWLVDWFKSKVGFGGAGGPGVQRGLAFAKAQAGKPYVWGGVGPGGYDCSGLWSAIVNVIHGRNPYSRLFSTMSFGASGGPGGFVRNLNSAVKVGVTNAGVGHMAGTIGRLNIESSGSRGVHLGAGARGFDDPLFGFRYGLKADTGTLALRRGWNPPVYNGTGSREVLSTRAAGGVTIGKLELHFADDRNMYEKGKEFARGLEEYKRRGGRIPTP